MVGRVFAQNGDGRGNSRDASPFSLQTKTRQAGHQYPNQLWLPVGIRLDEELLQVTADCVDGDSEIVADRGKTHPRGDARGNLGLHRREPVDSAKPL